MCGVCVRVCGVVYVCACVWCGVCVCVCGVYVYYEFLMIHVWACYDLQPEIARSLVSKTHPHLLS